VAAREPRTRTDSYADPVPFEQASGLGAAATPPHEAGGAPTD
jgi:hypothetical protein